MNFEQVFGKAKWIGYEDPERFCAIRDRFTVKAGEKAEITVLGFGRFVLYVNSKRVHKELFLPLNSNFESVGRNCENPAEVMDVRCYPCVFDLTPFICEGENVICLLLGGGWYVGTKISASQGPYGTPKACYSIRIGNDVGERYHYSDENH